MPLMIFEKTHRSLVTAAMVALIAGCDGGFHLSARVVDSEGHVIPHAKVLATSGKSTETFNTISDSRGCLSLGGVIAPGKYDFTVSVAAQGYKPLEFAVPTLQYRTYQIVLAKAKQTFTSQAQAFGADELKSHCGGI